MASIRGLLTRRTPWSRTFGRAFSSTGLRAQESRKTGLYDLHVAQGAKMVDFAGYSMPLLYGDVGQIQSHNHVRTHAGLFDVGHMVQSMFTGKSALAFLEYLTPSSISSLPEHGSTLSVLLNPAGGIIDDTIVTKHSNTQFYVVTNAGRRDRDLAWFAEQLDAWNADRGKDEPVGMEVLEDWGLVALQGPESASVLQTLVDVDLSKVYFGRSAYAKLGGAKVHIARGGYTGEDGFEISIEPKDTVAVAEAISALPNVQWAGLGARDSLRLEAGMCLYGHDLDETIGPIEAGLAWLVGKDRRERADFIGAEEVLRVIKDGPSRRRVGFVVQGAPAREGMAVFDKDGNEQLGVITSGIPSPTLGQNIAMGYVKNGFHKKGTELSVEVRKKFRPAVVSPMPFVPSRYYRG